MIRRVVAGVALTFGLLVAVGCAAAGESMILHDGGFIKGNPLASLEPSISTASPSPVVGINSVNHALSQHIDRSLSFPSEGEPTCIDNMEGVKKHGQWKAMDCAHAHDGELYQLYGFANIPYPGDDELNEFATVACEGAFEDFAGVELKHSRLEIVPILPSAQSWNDPDDPTRVAFCAVRAPTIVRGTLHDQGY